MAGMKLLWAVERKGETIEETVAVDAQTCLYRLVEYLADEADEDVEATLLDARFVRIRLDSKPTAKREG